MKQLTWLALYLAMLLHAIGFLVGCQSSDAPLSSQPAKAIPTVESKVLMDPAATMPVLRGALVQPTVVSAKTLLESEGYTYVEANSMVLIQQTVEESPTTFDAASRGPRPPRNPSRVDRIRTDTMSWLAFENPTHDLGNHTAVLHYSNGLTSSTVLIELDVSREWPRVIRQGYMSDSGFVAADIGTESWLACVLGGGAAAAVRCAFTNCGWGHCAALSGAAVLVGCTIGALVDRAMK